MSIRARQITKVIIGGQWFTVFLGSFEVVDMEFLDEDGNPLHTDEIGVKAYHFRSENKDEYYGPLSAIELFKLIDV